MIIFKIYCSLLEKCFIRLKLVIWISTTELSTLNTRVDIVVYGVTVVRGGGAFSSVEYRGDQI